MTYPIDSHPVLATWAAAVFTALTTGALLQLWEPTLPLRSIAAPALGSGVGMFAAMTYLRRRRARDRERRNLGRNGPT